jgi:hypothetical protein
MSSKRGLLLSFALALGFVFGCAGENEAFFSPKSIKFDGPRYSCLKKAGTTVSRFASGELSNGELDAFFTCLDSAVVQFVTYVRGEENDSYRPDEVASFLDRFFLGNIGLANDAELLAQLMVVKALLIGGTAESISHKDLMERSRDVFRQLKAITLELNPHMKTVARGFKNSSGQPVTAEHLAAANAALKTFGQKISALLARNNVTYSFSKFEALVVALENFLQRGNRDFELNVLKKYLELTRELKGMLVSRPTDSLLPQDWVRLLEVGSAAGSWLLNFNLKIRALGWNYGEGLDGLEQLLGEVFAELERGLALQPDQTFAYADLDKIVKALDDLKLLPLELDAATVQSLLRGLGEKVLDPAPGGRGLDGRDLTRLKGEIQRWIEAQYYLNQQVAGRPVRPTRAQFRPAEAPIRPSSGATELESLIGATKWPLLIDARGRIEFSNRAFTGRYDRESLSTLNWERALIRAVMRAYTAQSSADGAAPLTLAQFTQLAKDWQPLFVKFGLFQPGEAEAKAKRILMEANLFMPSANGDDFLDFKEATQYLAFAISGYRGSGLIRDRILPRCPVGNAPGKMEPVCFRRELFLQRAELLAHMPFLLGYIGNSQDRFNQFLSNAENVVRRGEQANPWGRGDVAELLVLLSYGETYFGNFDTNRSQTINVPESIVSFPIFEKTLTVMAGGSLGPEDILPLFTYMFKYGAPPDSDFGGMVKFLNWKWAQDKWQYEADRMGWVGILAELAERQ